jgi:chromosome segregation ATPase
VAAANDEIIQLKATINALRHELEVQRLDNQTHARQALSAANSEITQLRATVMSLREQLERYDAG